MKTKTEIKVYEVNGEPVKLSEAHITIQSHWPHNTDRVLIDLGDRTITVLAHELIKATQNAINI